LRTRGGEEVQDSAIASSPPASSCLTLIGIGPGDLAQLTPAARDALSDAEVVVGYHLYIDMVRPLLGKDQEIHASPIGDELARARQAIELAAAGHCVALISSGDIGIYAMAGPVFELLRERGWQGHTPEVVVLPGISAVQAAAARLGAPISHDFCTISLSDLLTPWELIERRVRAAAWGDFVIAFYNPRSRDRDWQLARAIAIVREQRDAATPAALVRDVARPDESIVITTLGDLDPAAVDMFTLVLVGNSRSYVVGGRMATPRGYDVKSRGDRQTGMEEAISGRGDQAKHKDRADSSPRRLAASSPHETYPITLTNLRDAPVVVVGGGAVGGRKVRGLLAAGAAVRLVSPAITPELRALADTGAIEWHARPYQQGDLAGARLAFIATNQRTVNAQVAGEAAALGLLCNVADDPQAGDFHLPAVHREPGLLVAVSTEGVSPARAKQLRDQIAAWLATSRPAQEEP
jgi:cobalt-precorrin 5A hydrolase/precorrin-3B C17-methyltransferase